MHDEENRWLGMTGVYLKMKIFLRWLLLLSIMLIPFWHYGEVMDIFNSSVRNQAALHTPFFLILIKNLLVPMMVVISFLLWFSEDSRVSHTEIVALFVLMFLLIVSVLMTPNMDAWKFISGIRWYLPFFLMVLIISLVDKDSVRQFAYASIVIMAVNLMMQLWQLGHMNAKWWGWIPGTSLAARTPGFFPLPATAAMFTCFSVLFALLIFKDMRIRWAMATLGMISVCLTQSGTGFCVMLIILATLASGPYWRVLLPVIVPISYGLTMVILPYFRGRQYFANSFGTREQLLTDALDTAATSATSATSATLDWLFGANFGLGTNLAVLMRQNFGIDIIAIGADSFLTQLIVNLGGIGLLIYLLLMTAATLAAYRAGSKVTVLWLFAIGIFSVTVTITEAFPMFLMIILAIAYSVKRGDFGKIK